MSFEVLWFNQTVDSLSERQFSLPELLYQGRDDCLQVEARSLDKLFKDFQGSRSYFVVRVWKEFDHRTQNVLHEDVTVDSLSIYFEFSEELLYCWESDFPIFIIFEVLEQLFS